MALSALCAAADALREAAEAALAHGVRTEGAKPAALSACAVIAATSTTSAPADATTTAATAAAAAAAAGPCGG